MTVSQSKRLDTILTVTLVICAVVAVGIMLRREFFGASAAGALKQEHKNVFIQDWRKYLAAGQRMGPMAAPVQLLEFSDFECPFCATLHQELKRVRQRHPSQLALTYVHFPLPMHRFAEPAARAAECAGEQQRFEAMHDRLFEQQNAFGLKPWSELAREAGVTDLAAFDICFQRKEPVPRIAAGQQLGQQLAVQGTPTLIVNGWKLGRPPNEAELERIVQAVLAENSPVATDSKTVR